LAQTGDTWAGVISEGKVGKAGQHGILYNVLGQDRTGQNRIGWLYQRN
jgi:hypothetical protein